MIRSLLKSFRHTYLDLRLRSSGLHIRILERPGLWMQDAELEQLSDDLRKVASATLPVGSLTYGVFSADRKRMSSSIVTLVSRPDGTPIAFNALAIMTLSTLPKPTEVLHLGLVMVDPNERSKNLSWVLYGLTCFLLFVRRKFRPLWISNVTQVPAVVGMVSGMFSNVYPSPSASRRTLSQLQVARRIMADHRYVFGVGDEADFDENRFVITNAYTGGSDDLMKTWEQAPKHRDDSYNDFCARELDYERGDDVLQIGQLDMAAIGRYLSKEVPSSALSGLLLVAGMVILRRLILPILHWFESDQEWSILRPVKDKTNV
ncbi:hypothetical protein [Aestuariibius sp. HNIBRBA575]|uniref:hypothetical protein n=1 Tax=Aestuariibius sp. HNIBRBA575 TaxID=3233343 RepID=UPI0034A43CFF